MFLIQSHVDLPSCFGGEANVTLSRLVRRANHVYFACDTYKNQLMMLQEKIMVGIGRGKCVCA